MQNHCLSHVTNEKFDYFNQMDLILITEGITNPIDTLAMPLYNKCCKKLGILLSPNPDGPRTQAFVKSGSIFADLCGYRSASVSLECWNIEVPEHASTVIPERNTPDLFDWNWYFEKEFGTEL